MVAPREYVLLPANRAFIAFSLALAFVLNLFPWGRLAFAPDFVALVLVFWNLRQPHLVGIGVAFAFGLLMDVHSAALLGVWTIVDWFLIMGRTKEDNFEKLRQVLA